MIKLRAFRAIDDLNACKKFMLGHRAVLENIGVKKITSSKDEWMENPAVFVIIVENIESNKVLGGARVHVSEGKQPLPIEEATGYLDDSIYGIIKKYADNGTGEICGLWNSREALPLLAPTSITVLKPKFLNHSIFFSSESSFFPTPFISKPKARKIFLTRLTIRLEHHRYL